MTTLGFTGARDVSDGAKAAIVRGTLDALPTNIDLVVTGACIGVDTFVAVYYAVHHPTILQRIYVPANRTRVHDDFLKLAKTKPDTIEIVEMGEDTSYADRNRKIVKDCTELIGFPEYPESDPRSQRSGTWQTIRMARGKGKPNFVHVLTTP